MQHVKGGITNRCSMFHSHTLTVHLSMAVPVFIFCMMFELIHVKIMYIWKAVGGLFELQLPHSWEIWLIYTLILF